MDINYEYVVRPEFLQVHRTRSDDVDSDWLHFSVRVFDFREGVANDARLVSTQAKDGQIAPSVRSGDRIAVTRRDGHTGDLVNDFEVRVNLRPTDVLTVDYLVTNQSHEIHDPSVQRERFNKTVATYEKGIGIGGTVATLALAPFGLVPGLISGAITGGVVSAMQAVKEIIALFPAGDAGNCDGPVMTGVWSIGGEDLAAATDNPDKKYIVSNRYGEPEGVPAPEACGGRADTEITVSVHNEASTSFAPGASDPSTWDVQTVSDAPLEAWIGQWGDRPELLRSQVTCRIALSEPAAWVGIAIGEHASSSGPHPPTTLDAWLDELAEPHGGVVVHAEASGLTPFMTLAGSAPMTLMLDLGQGVQLQLCGAYSGGELQEYRLRYVRVNEDFTLLAQHMLVSSAHIT